jgi:hypothetical protein
MKRYMGLLYRLEREILRYSRERGDLADRDVLREVDLLTRSLSGERVSGGGLFMRLSAICKDYMMEEPLTQEEMIQCFERILESIKRHSRDEGREYLDFIARFMRRW